MLDNHVKIIKYDHKILIKIVRREIVCRSSNRLEALSRIELNNTEGIIVKTGNMIKIISNASLIFISDAIKLIPTQHKSLKVM